MLDKYQPAMELSQNFAEIERKFLLKGSIPSDVALSTLEVHRSYLYTDSQVEMRIQKRGEDRYELERKIADPNSPLVRWSMKASISAAEFETLRKSALGNQISYFKHKTNMPGVTIKQYLDHLAGLAIVEAEFADLYAAEGFHPSLPWFGPEITGHAFSRDSGLIHVANFADLAQHLPVL